MFALNEPNSPCRSHYAVLSSMHRPGSAGVLAASLTLCFELSKLEFMECSEMRPGELRLLGHQWLMLCLFHSFNGCLVFPIKFKVKLKIICISTILSMFVY